MNHELRRDERRMPDDDARQLLESADYGVLGLGGSDGEPYTVPLNYVVSGETVLVHCATEGRKLAILRESPRVSFTVVGDYQILPDRFTTHYRSVHVSGTARVVHDAAERRSALLLLGRKYAPDLAAEAERYVDSAFTETAVVEIAIDTVTGKQNPSPQSR
ncbi:MAG: pyridoxamine 5'-phosphate oxidase family protein [Spirochaetota bacterium]